MAINFPSSPTNGQVYTDTTSAMTWVYSTTNTAWSGSFNRSNYVSQTFTATAGQTSFTITGGYLPTLIEVYQNGVLLVNGTDVTVTSGTVVVLASGAIAGDIIQVIGNSTFNIANVDASAITSGTLAVARGGTGLSSPGTAGNLLTSNGTAWTSTAPAAVASVLTGTIIRSGSSTAPSGYLACNGTVYNDASYSALHAAIGNIPNFRPTPFAIGGDYLNTSSSSIYFANGVLFTNNSYSTDSGATWTTATGTVYATRINGWGNMVFVSPYYFYSQNNGGYAYRTAFNVAGATNTLAGANLSGMASSGSRIWSVYFNSPTSSIIANPSGAPGTSVAGVAAGAGNLYQDVAYGNGTFVAVGSSSTLSGGSYGRVWTSADGTASTLRTLPAGFATINGASLTVSFVNSLFVITDQTSGSVASSSDGITWTLTAPAYSVAPFSNTVNTAGPFLSAIPYAGNRVQYVGGIYFSGSYYSTDLINWALIPPFQFQNGNGYYSYPVGPCVSDGTRMYYNGVLSESGCATNVYALRCYFTPFNYTPATQFLVPYIIDLQSPGVYYYIKT